MKKLIFLSFISTMFCFTSGCVRDAKNVKLTQTEPKLVVTSFISPDDTILKVKITKSKPVLGQQDPFGYVRPVSDAQVSISDGSQTVTLTFDDSLQSYTFPMQGLPNFIKAGGTYFLSASTPDGKSVSASTTVPINKVDASTAIITFREFTDGGFTRDVIDFTFFDIPNEENFYRVEAYLVTNDNSNRNSVEEVYFNYDEEDSRYNLYKDQNRNGKEFKIVEGNYNYYGQSPSSGSQEIFVNVYNTSRAYYDYHKSIDSFQGDDPFSEPVLIYSNIKNGLGIFASYNTVQVSRFKP